MKELIEKLVNLSWIQVGDDGLVQIPRSEKRMVISTRDGANTYWINAGALLALLEKESK